MRGLRRTHERIPHRVRVLCLVAFTGLVLLPLAITGVRSSNFSASVQAFPVSDASGPAVREAAAYVRGLLNDPTVFEDTATTAGFSTDAASLPSRVRITPAPGGALITARADSPDHARLLVSALAAQVANASARDLASKTNSELAEIQHALDSSTVGSPRRATLLRMRDRLESEASRTRFPLAMGPRPGPPRPTSMADRALDRLPGPLPPRPSFGWIAVVGLALTGLVCAAAFSRAVAQSGERWLGAWLLPLSRTERADLLSFSQKFGHEHEEELALGLVQGKERAARQWQDIVEEFAIRFPPTRKRSRVLLFGCGSGDEALLLARAGYELTLTDADALTLRFALHRLGRRGFSAKVVVIDPRRPVVDGVFDAIFVSELGTDGLDRSAAARALRAALRPGAMLVEKRPRLDGDGRGRTRPLDLWPGRLAS
jgi:SAM-dependent methyltransferase